MRLLRLLFGLVLGLVLAVVLAVAGLWWWSGTEGSAAWVLQQAARRQPFVAEGVTGSLRRGLRAQRLEWRQDGLTVEARDVELAWQPLALLDRTLRLDRLAAAQVRVQDRRPPGDERMQLPASLDLPWELQVQLGDVEVAHLVWDGARKFDLRDLRGGYQFAAGTHQLALRNLRMLDGHYAGELRLGAQQPFALSARLQGRIAAPVPGGRHALPLRFEAKADGVLEQFELDARLRAEQQRAGVTAPRADVVAQVAPFAPLPLVRARAELDALDLAALWPQAPRTQLSGRVGVQPQAADAWAISADLRNAIPGAWDLGRWPAQRVRAEGDWRAAGGALVRELDAELGGGSVVAQGRWDGAQAWQVEGQLSRVDPAAIHTALAPVPVTGRASARGRGEAIDFEARLEAAGPARRARAANEAAAAVSALELRSLHARGRWAGEDLSLPLLQVRTADARLDAALDLRPRAQAGRGRIDLEAPGLRVRAVGSVARDQGGGTARVTLASIADAQAWLRKLPEWPDAWAGPPLAGRGEVQLAWQGGWQDPGLEGNLTLATLQPQAANGAAPAWSVRDFTARVDGRLADARLDVRTQALFGERQAQLEMAVRGGRRPRGAWEGQVGSLQAAVRDPAIAREPWRVTLRQPLDWSWSGRRLEAGAGEATLAAPLRGAAPALVRWEPVVVEGSSWQTAGRITGLPMGWLELASPQLAGSALAGDLVFDGRWKVRGGDALQAEVLLERRSGDVSVLAETLDGGSARVQAGVREARLALLADGENVNATFRWDSERAGSVDARLDSRLAGGPEGWSWPGTAPLSGSVRAQLPRLGVWSLLAPPGWRLRGSVSAEVAVAGTRADPLLRGQLRADDLALRSVVDGVALQDGRLRARLEGREVVLEELVLRGAGAQGGSVAGTGRATWTAAGLQAQVATRLENLRVSARTDRQLAVSGQLTARMGADAAQLQGRLRVDQARIELPDEARPRLGDDVVVRNLPPGVELGTARNRPQDGRPRDARPLDIAINLDLGDDFRVSGRGIQTRLTGSLTVAGESLAEPRLNGVIRTVGGEYRAYGQRLEIERGVLRFTGAPDNPALDVLAIRPRLEQRVGVQVTGRAQSPFVRLYSEPELAEAEKLSWLVLGRSAASGGAETALLQSAAVALLQKRAGAGGGKGPAELLGLDELGFRREGADGPAVTLGKRLGRNLYASYERSLSGAVGTLYLFYDLSQRLTLRAQAGERAAVDLIVTFTYD